MLRLQDEHDDVFFFVADWHMLTTHYDRTDELPEFVRGLMLDWLAAGLDPGKATTSTDSLTCRVAEMALTARDDGAAGVAGTCALLQGTLARHRRT